MTEAGPSIVRPKKRSRSSTEQKSSDKFGESSIAKRGGSPVEAENEDDLNDEAGKAEDGEDEQNERDAASLAREKKSKKAKKAKLDATTPGIVYISRLPPGMTPQKVRHLMAKWGDVGKVYAQRRDGESLILLIFVFIADKIAPTGYNPNSSTQKKQKHQLADFTEAWVEFLSKSVAKMVAQMLNAQMIGGKKGEKWRDDIWTMRYLSGFKWEMLGEQIGKFPPLLCQWYWLIISV